MTENPEEDFENWKQVYGMVIENTWHNKYHKEKQ